METVSVLEKLLWGEKHTCLFFCLNHRCPQHQGWGERNEGHEGDSILFLHALISESQPFNPKHPFYPLRSFQVNRSLHSFQNSISLLVHTLPYFLSLMMIYTWALWWYTQLFFFFAPLSSNMLIFCSRNKQKNTEKHGHVIFFLLACLLPSFVFALPPFSLLFFFF